MNLKMCPLNIKMSLLTAVFTVSNVDAQKKKHTDLFSYLRTTKVRFFLALTNVLLVLEKTLSTISVTDCMFSYTEVE